jgi:hypothetical protein
MGFALVLAFPVIMLLVGTEIRKPYVFLAPFSGSAVVFLGFVGIGAGSRAAGGVLRGGLAGAAVYVVLGAVLGAAWVLRFGSPPDLFGFLYVSLGWPLLGLYLFGLFGA